MCDVLPLIIVNACSNTGSIISIHSLTAFGLPGKLIIRHFFLNPEIPLLNIDKFVFFNVSNLIASVIPGISLSKTFFVASGVKSLGPNPVPPVVIIISAI